VTERLKLSPFTSHLENDGNVLWFNSLSGEFLRMAEGQHRVVCRLLQEPGNAGHDVLGALHRQGYLATDPAAERAQAHDRYLAGCAADENLYLTIAPTLACNARCRYCFQREIAATSTTAARMSPSVREDLCALVANWSTAHPDGALVVQWFGGEPLGALDLILECTRRMRAAVRQDPGKYQAEMITNGLMLRGAPLRKRLSDAHLSSLQISLDGTADSYAHRKGVSRQLAEQLYRALAENLVDLASVVGRLVIRVNVDADNVAQAAGVIDFFAERGGGDERVVFQLGQLGEVEGSSDCSTHSCLTGAEFTDQQVAFVRHARSRGFTAFGMPQPERWTCGAVLRNHITVAPDGSLGKCTPLIGTGQDVLAQLGTGLTIEEIMRRVWGPDNGEPPFTEFDPFVASQCLQCSLIPLCLGACAKDQVPQVAGRCSAQVNLEKRILAFAS
jgi:uncharacterized protein